MLRCSNELCHIILDVLAAPWRENNIFGFFGVRPANQGQTKYGINNCPFFIWHLECNERCWIKNVNSNFVAPKFACRDYSWIGTKLLPNWTDLLQLLLKYFLDTSLNSRKGKCFFFFFFWGLTGSTLTWSTLPDDPSRCAGLTWRPNKMHRAARPPQRPIKASSCWFWTHISLSFDFPLLKKFFRVISSLAGSSFQLQSVVLVFFALEVSIYFSSSLLFSTRC